MYRVATLTRTLQDACVARLIPVINEFNGFIYGSWALRAQCSSLARIPNDIDIGFSAGGNVSTILNAFAALLGEDLWGNEPVEFSSADSSPVSYRIGVTSTVGDFVGDVVLGLSWVTQHDDSHIVRLTLGDGGVLGALEWSSCLAQKYLRLSQGRTGGRRHTRWQDVMDMWDVGVHLDLSQLQLWRTAIVDEARRRGLKVVGRLDEPPDEWADSWYSRTFADRVNRPGPKAAVMAINQWVGASSLVSRQRFESA